LTGLDLSFLQIKTKIASCHTADSKLVKQEVNCTVILPPLIFPAESIQLYQAWARLPFERKRTGWNCMRNGINWMGLVFKILLITFPEWQMETVNIVPNEHKQYLPFALSLSSLLYK
jgi:hypothetical protein